MAGGSLKSIRRLLRFDSHHALHDREMAWEAANEGIVTSCWRSEGDFVGFTATKHLRMRDHLLLGFLVLWNITIVLGRSALCGESRNHCSFIEDHNVMAHCYGWKLADMFEG